MNLGETIVSVCVILMMSVGMTWQGNRIGKLKASNAELTSQLSQQVEINKDYQARITRLNQLDIKYTQELASAKNEIDGLRDDIRNGTKRVYIKAECPKSDSSTSSSLDVSRPTPVERDTEENILNLEEQIETLESQYLGLRDYTNTECLR
ncbi:TPA: lysis protein [Proteus mirabilis]|nr:lysis protein [Proteus mirabilis]